MYKPQIEMNAENTERKIITLNVEVLEERIAPSQYTPQ